MASSKRSVPTATVETVYSATSKLTRHVALRREVIDLVGAHVLDEVRKGSAVLEIAVHQAQAVVGRVRILIDALEALGVERARAPHDAVDLVAFESRSSARYEPSCPVTPVINAFFIGAPGTTPRSV